MNVGDVAADPLNIKTLEEDLNKSVATLSVAGDPQVPKKKKKGHTHKHLTMEEE